MFRRLSSSFKSTRKNYRTRFKITVGSNYRSWIKLFISALIPLMIGIFTIISTLSQEKLSSEQREQDKQDAILLRQQSERQADNLHKDTIFATYLDDISKLLLLENRTRSLIHIRAKTLTTLRQLDPERKKHLLLFLYENELIFRDPSQPVSILLKVNEADFDGIYLRGTTENKCSFTRLYLYDVYLSNSSFISCYIDRSNFSSSTMYRTLFDNALVTRTWFKFTFLDKTRFRNTKLYLTSFLGASLIDCNFTGSVWADHSVDFTNANLTGAIISNEQLHNSTLFNCILPNGTWGPIQTDNLFVNGDAEENCTINGSSISNGWTVGNRGDIKMFAYPKQNNTENFGKCYFRVTSFFQARKVAFMYQLINLESFTLLISTGNARYNASVNFQCFGRQYGIIELRFIDLNGLRYEGVSNETLDGTHMQSVQLSQIIRSDVRSVQILITFVTTGQSNTSNATLDQDYCICDNVNFSIMKL